MVGQLMQMPTDSSASGTYTYILKKIENHQVWTHDFVIPALSRLSREQVRKKLNEQGGEQCMFVCSQKSINLYAYIDSYLYVYLPQVKETPVNLLPSCSLICAVL